MNFLFPFRLVSIGLACVCVAVTLVIAPPGYADKQVSEVVVRFDDGSQQIVPRPTSAPATQPATQPSIPPTPPAEVGLRKVFPENSGIVDVKLRYGARGDGVTDDTLALQRAISENINHTNHPAVLYLQAGTYLVSDTLKWQDGANRLRPYLELQGEGAAFTTLKLKDRAKGFDDPKLPKPVIMTAGLPNKAWPDAVNAVGGGNAAFQNSLYDLTIDTGSGNPGAIGIDYLASNKGTLRNIVVRSGDGAGVAGISMLRDWPGPALLSHVSVQGFDIGLDHRGSNGLSVTGEHLHFTSQQVAPLRNVGGLMSLRKVDADRAIVNEDNGGYTAMMILHDSPGVNVEGKGQLVRAGSVGLPVADAPQWHDDDPDQWAMVSQPNGVNDTPAIQQAIDSGKSTVCLVDGTFRIVDTIVIRGHVKRILGISAALRFGPRFSDAKSPADAFRFEGDHTLIFERLSADGRSTGPGSIWMHHVGKGTLVMRDLYTTGTMYVASPGAGDAHFENITSAVSNPSTFASGQHVWARQFNPESSKGAPTKAINDGADFWVLGMKCEGAGTLIDTRGTGRTELLGGFTLCSGKWPSEIPALLAGPQSTLFAAYLELLHNKDNGITCHVRQGEQTVTRDNVPRRGLGSRVIYPAK